MVRLKDHECRPYETLDGRLRCAVAGCNIGRAQPPEPAPRARRTDPETSHAAAAAAGSLAQSQRAAILALLRENPAGLIHTELDELLSAHYSSAGKRLPELERLGLAEPNGETRPTPSGRPARVWVAV